MLNRLSKNVISNFTYLPITASHIWVHVVVVVVVLVVVVVVVHAVFAEKGEIFVSLRLIVHLYF